MVQKLVLFTTAPMTSARPKVAHRKNDWASKKLSKVMLALLPALAAG